MYVPDFLSVRSYDRNGIHYIAPEWVNDISHDLMTRGNKFYAVWDDGNGVWSTSIFDLRRIVDNVLEQEYNHYTKNAHESDNPAKVLYLRNDSNKVFREFLKYCGNREDNFISLNTKVVFADQKPQREDYASFKLPYSMHEGDMSAYDQIMHTIYSPSELKKIEWAIGAVIAGETIDIQKAIVLYGPGGSGKSTTLDLIKALFTADNDNKYYTVFNAKDLISGRNQFATTSFKNNSPIAIQDDGDLSKSYDTTVFKSIISHKEIIVNEKNKGLYSITPVSLCFLATNDTVDFKKLKDGMTRRMLIAYQTGHKITPKSKFLKLNRQMLKYELGAIAKHCYDVYMSFGENRSGAYDDELPKEMLYKGDPMYNFVLEKFYDISEQDGITLNDAWDKWKAYCLDSNILPGKKLEFKDSLSEYFDETLPRYTLSDGTNVRMYFKGFRKNLLGGVVSDGSKKQPKTEPIHETVETKPLDIPDWLVLKEQPSLFDKYAKDFKAQYSTSAGTPRVAWDRCNTTLNDIQTGNEHYVYCPENIIVLDLDKKNSEGKKDALLNLHEAAKYPKTYAEFSRGGAGVHLTYIYTGDPKELEARLGDEVEIKHCSKTGGSWALRRKLTKCNDIPIATLTSGLPIKEKKNTEMINPQQIKDEKHLTNLIAKALRKEIPPGATVTSVDFIDKVLNEAYDQGIDYDVTPMKSDIWQFASHSTNHAKECQKKVLKMKFKSEKESEPIPYKPGQDDLVFFDIEVFPNLLVVVYKTAKHKCTILINPSPEQVEELFQYKLIGFNNRRYDNHILYARSIGYSLQKCYELSQKIVNGGKKSDAMFGAAYNLSYTDIWDFASNVNKKSLKKLEIEMNNISIKALQKKGFSEEDIKLIKSGGHHQELGLDWDKPVDESLWSKVGEYCCNDVIATEAAFTYLRGDWIAREMLAAITGKTVNDTTNQLTAALIFGGNKEPQTEFIYTDLSTGKQYPYGVTPQERKVYDNPRQASLDLAKDYDLEKLIDISGSNNFFPGYIFDENTKTSWYLGEEIGEGGYVYAEPGMYGWATTKDVASMHPHSLIALNLFGKRFTKIFQDLVEARIDIKHKDYTKARQIFDGKLAPYLTNDSDAKAVASALKTAINSVYGLTSASYPNAFKDLRNVDNIVAKRGELFMITLKNIVQGKGYTVIHIKTDSIKIANPDKSILDFIIDFGHKYGYDFETEAEWDRLCLVNNAVLIGHKADNDPDEPRSWEAVGAQFAEPYVYKTLFSHEELVFSDFTEVKSVTKGALYLDFNEGLDNVSIYEEVYDLRKKYRNTLDINSLINWDDCKRKGLKITKKQTELLNQFKDTSDEDLDKEIAKGHSYQFIGRVGSFCPVKEGTGGGILVNDNKHSITGTKGYRWREEEDVVNLQKQGDIDYGYFEDLVNDAKNNLGKYGDVERFLDTSKVFSQKMIGIYSDDLPF